jgi:hypothetical protein
MRRVEHKVTDAESRAKLMIYRDIYGPGPYASSTLAKVIWPDAPFIAPQGAGAAASRVLKRLGCIYDCKRGKWGWMLRFSDNRPNGLGATGAHTQGRERDAASR